MTHQLTTPPGEAFCFPGFTRTTTIPIPDQVIDELLHQLSGAELKVVLYICRRTLGFQKLTDNISLHQLLFGLVKKNGERLDYGTGLSKPTLLKTLRDLQEKGIIATRHRSSSERGDEATNYRLCFAEGVQPVVCQRQPSEPTPVEVVSWRGHTYPPPGQKSLPGGRTKNLPTGVVKKSRPQYTEVQYTEIQETEARAIRQITTTNSSGPLSFGGGVQHSDSSFFVPDEESEHSVPHTASNHNKPSLPHFPPPASDVPPSAADADQPSGASALLAIGMTAKVAYRLTERYSLARIEEKLRYLDFLQAYQPDKVKNPCGWLRTAIEDNFAAPDGFLSAVAQVQQRADAVTLSDFLCEPAELPTVVPSVKDPDWSQVYAQYGTTDADRTLWKQAKQEFDLMGRAYVSTLLVDALILQCTEDTALIGVPQASHCPSLAHPQTVKLIQRTLTQLAGRPLTPVFIPLST